MDSRQTLTKQQRSSHMIILSTTELCSQNMIINKVSQMSCILYRIASPWSREEKLQSDGKIFFHKKNIVRERFYFVEIFEYEMLLEAECVNHIVWLPLPVKITTIALEIMSHSPWNPSILPTWRPTTKDLSLSEITWWFSWLN